MTNAAGQSLQPLFELNRAEAVTGAAVDVLWTRTGVILSFPPSLGLTGLKQDVAARLLKQNEFFPVKSHIICPALQTNLQHCFSLLRSLVPTCKTNPLVSDAVLCNLKSGFSQVH